MSNAFISRHIQYTATIEHQTRVFGAPSIQCRPTGLLVLDIEKEVHNVCNQHGERFY